ncbi:hypothetical protein M8J77_004237 [Diaphorina citri]|nr:hypothetical protein M8J77_004237 [Diaphorina citri]
MLRKILGPVKVNGEYRRRHNKELYEHMEDLVTSMRRRRMLFFGHLERMNQDRLTHQIHKSISNKKSYSKWAVQVRKDFEQANITEEEISDRNIFRDLVKSATLQPLTLATARPACKWSQQRKEAHSRKMKAYWQRKKASEN